MPSPSTQMGCFSGLSFKRLFRHWGAPCKPGPTDKSSVKCESKHIHAGSCFGDWGVEKEILPPYSDSDIKVKDVKAATLKPEIIKTIETKLDELNAELRDLSIKIHGRPELAFQEKYAHDILTNFMEKNGFQVVRNYAGLKTAWRAEFTMGSGGRVLGVNSEMDALPDIGHACGHNLIAVGGVGAAVAVKTALETHCIPGKVIILGTPAEEAGGGKVILLQRGAYKEMDVCLMSHPAPGVTNSAGLGSTTAVQTITAKYTGKTAHAAQAPWEGKNALDAAVVAYSSISALRQQIKPELRVHGIVEGKNWTANTIPDNAKLTYMIRAPGSEDLSDALARVKSCFEGAASATGCTVKIEMGPSYLDLRQNPVLAIEFANNIKQRYCMTVDDAGSSASTDFGNVSHEMPSLHPHYAIPTVPGGGNHTAEFTKSSATIEAHNAMMKVTKGLALTGFRILYDVAFFNEVIIAYEAERKTCRWNLD